MGLQEVITPTHPPTLLLTHPPTHTQWEQCPLT